MHEIVSFFFAICALWGFACLLGYNPFCTASMVGDGVALLLAGLVAYLFEVDR